MLPSDKPILVEKNAYQGQCASQPAPNNRVETTSSSA